MYRVANLRRWAAFALFILFSSALVVDVRAAAPPPGDLGVLTPFYRSTQLQGHLFGMELIAIPDYLLGSDIDIVYKKKPQMRLEVPFTDSFVINRFLGGYREDWLRKFHLWDEQLGLRSLDYAVRQSDGSLQYRADLIRSRLSPYLEAGYRPSDITIALENIPWDLARDKISQNAQGPWGQSKPPANASEWTDLIRHFALDLQAYLGPSAKDISFETGVEYDEKVSFDGSAADFFDYYRATERGLHAVFPNARFGPGEFTKLGACTRPDTGCVYDTRDLLEFAKANGLSVDDVPRSLYSLANKDEFTPSAAVHRAEASYARLPPVVPEIHQFGVLFQQFGKGDGGDLAGQQANWTFQALMGLWQQVRPRRVFHWNTFTHIGKLELLNGDGYVLQILDHYLGYHAFRLNIGETGPVGPGIEVMATGFVKGDQSALVVSSFSPQLAPGERTVMVDLPDTVLSGDTAIKALRFSSSDNVYFLIRSDLASENNLKPEFSACSLCVGPPMAMAVDPNRAREMIWKNWSRYVAEMKKSLRWTRAAPGVARTGRTLRVQVEPNEMVVLEDM